MLEQFSAHDMVTQKHDTHDRGPHVGNMLLVGTAMKRPKLFLFWMTAKL